GARARGPRDLSRDRRPEGLRRDRGAVRGARDAAAREGRRPAPSRGSRIIRGAVSTMVQVAVAGDVAEAEEIQEILRNAGIDSELRPVDEQWLEVVDALVRLGDLRGRRVLDVGTGTGALATALAERYACKVWAVEPSPEMLEIARSRVPRGVGLKLGSAEALPLKDRWFERAALRPVV